MKVVRWAAAATTALMGLMNLPIVLDDGGAGITKPIAALISVLGVLGLTCAVALLRRTSWAIPATLAVGALNVIGGVVAVTKSWDGAAIGLTVALIGTVLTALATREPGQTPVPQPL